MHILIVYYIQFLLAAIILFSHSANGQILPRHNHQHNLTPAAKHTSGQNSPDYYLRSNMTITHKNFNQKPISALLKETPYKYSDSLSLAWRKKMLEHKIGPYSEIAGIEPDKDGNIYLLVHSTKIPIGTEMVILKYSPSGEMIWQRHCYDPGSESTEAVGLTIDSSGTILVCGNSSNGYVYMALYNSAGSQCNAWRYSGIIHYAVRIINDRFGRTILMGRRELYSHNSTVFIGSMYKDEPKWEKEIPDADRYYTMIPDTIGNIIVLKNSESDEFEITKLSPSGKILWTLDYSDKIKSKLILSYISHYKNFHINNKAIWFSIQFREGNGDYWTHVAKINSKGFLCWYKRIDVQGRGGEHNYFVPTYIQPYQDGSITVAGFGTTSQTCNAVTLDSTGNVSSSVKLYTYIRYNHINIATDLHKNFYISETDTDNNSTTIVKTDSAGNTTFKTRKEPSIVITTHCISRDNIYLAGKTYPSRIFATLVKIGSFGGEEWQRHYKGEGSHYNLTYTLKTDKFNNCICGGMCYTSNSERATLVYKLDEFGNTLWSNVKQANEGASEFLQGISIGGSGDVYTVSSMEGSIATYVFDSDGRIEGQDIIPATGSTRYYPYGIIDDSLGNWYITGTISRPGSNHYFIAKYSGNAEMVWMKEHHTEGGYLFSPAIDPEGNIAVSGYDPSYSESMETHFFHHRWNPEGTIELEKNFDINAAVDDSRLTIFDEYGNMYIILEDLFENLSTFAIKFDIRGKKLWEIYPPAPDYGSTHPLAVSTDYHGNILLLQRYYDGAHKTQLCKISGCGKILWTRMFSNRFATLQVDCLGSSYISLDNGMLCKYDTNGKFVWSASTGITVSYDRHNLFTVTDSLDLIRITNNYHGPAYSHSEIFKWRQILTEKEKAALTSRPSNFSISNAFPNPFNTLVHFKYNVPRDCRVTITVYNVKGQDIALIVNKNQHAGTYRTLWNPGSMPCGVYIAQIRAGTYTQTRKMLYLK